MTSLTRTAEKPTENPTETRPVIRDTGAPPRILVVGTAIPETVVHGPGGPERRGIGGVAATIAIALGQAVNNVTLVTSVGQGIQGDLLRELLADTPVRVILKESRTQAGYAVIQTNRGEQGRAQGNWPRPTGLRRTVDAIAGQYDCIVADCNMTPENLMQVLGHPGKYTMVNGTTPRACERIVTAGLNGIGMLTINEAEFRMLLSRTQTRQGADLMRKLRVETLLTTRGHNGWDLTVEGEVITSPVVRPPEHTDFIGCGDYAAAGALHARLHGLDYRETIQAFITRKLEENVVLPAAG